MKETINASEENFSPVEPVDINYATLEELTKIPGVGKNMASRIVAWRPYSKIEEIEQVPGIGNRLLERIRPYIKAELPSLPEPHREVVTIGKYEEKQAPIPLSNGKPAHAERPVGDSEGNGQMVKIIPFVGTGNDSNQPASEAPEAQKPQVKPGFRRYQVLLLVFCMGILAILLATLLSLGVLVWLNNGLDFAPRQQVNSMSIQLQTANAGVSSMGQEIKGIQEQVVALETLNEKFLQLESQADELEQALQGGEEQLHGLETQVQQYNQDLAQIEKDRQVLESEIQRIEEKVDNSVSIFATQNGANVAELAQLRSDFQTLEKQIYTQAFSITRMEEALSTTPAPAEILNERFTPSAPAESSGEQSTPPAPPASILLLEETNQLSKLEAEVEMIKVMEFLGHARLCVLQQNYGLAVQDIQRAQAVIGALKGKRTPDQDVSAESWLERTTMILAALPRYPDRALADMDILWDLLSGELVMKQATEAPILPFFNLTPTAYDGEETQTTVGVSATETPDITRGTTEEFTATPTPIPTSTLTSFPTRTPIVTRTP